MANPYLDQIELPSGNTYDLVDSGARDLIAAINNWEYVVCTSAANTPKDVTWDDGGTTITGTLVAASTTMYKIYLVPSINGTSDIYDEYVTVNPSGSTYTWEMFGNTKLPDMTQYVKNKSGHSGGTAGELGYKDTASGSTTVAVPKTYTTTFTGNGFLRYQVRNMVGLLIKIGENKLSPTKVTEILEAKDRTKAGKTAPPEGLYLVDIKYK